MKTCRRCHQTKNSVCFAADHRKADGQATICRDCEHLDREHSATRLRSREVHALRSWSLSHVGLPGELEA